MNTAFLFPGQGSQYAGMGKSLADRFRIARSTFEEADEALGFSLSKLCFEGPADALQLTENTQPARIADVALPEHNRIDTRKVRQFVNGLFGRKRK